MKKTNVTSIQPLSWITSGVGQCMQWVLASLFLVLGSFGAQAQPGPNCVDVNASIDADGLARVQLQEMLSNYPEGAGPAIVDVKVENAYGGLVPFYLAPDPTMAGATYYNGFVQNANAGYWMFINACPYTNQALKVTFTAPTGSCWSLLTFKQSNGPIIPTHTTYLYCLEEEVTDWGLYLDRFYSHDAYGNPAPGNGNGKYEPQYDYKEAYIPCFGTIKANFVADWVVPYDCILGNDTAKIIYREFEAFDKNGKRGSAFDTIYVWRLPEITEDNIYCAEKDTLYCGVGDSPGPYIVVDSIDPWTGLATGFCDTLPLLDIKNVNGVLTFTPANFDPKCGIAVHVDAWKFEDPCSPQYKVTVEVKQSCWGAPDDCVVTPPADGPGTPNAFEEVSDGYWRCTFWIIDFDTVPPLAEVKYDKVPEQNLAWPIPYAVGAGNSIPGFDSEHQPYGNAPIHCYPTPDRPGSSCYAPVIIVSTTSHECAAHTYIPPLCVYDDWSGVKQVKARIEGIGAWVLTNTNVVCDELNTAGDYQCDPDYNVNGYCYESHQQVKLPKSEYPYQVLYEIYDMCHNIDTVYAYILVKDQTKPVAVADKGVTVSLSSKKVWVHAETFDEGSWDNCGVNFILARRSDWYEFCIDLCDSTKICAVGEHGDTLKMAILETDKHKDEVEAHYAKTLDWLCYDGVPCGDLIYNAWQYDLMKYATLHCIDHPYEVDNQYFRHLFEQAYEDWMWERTDTKESFKGGGYKKKSILYDCDPRPGYEEYCFGFDHWKWIPPYFAPGCFEHGSDDNISTMVGAAGKGFFQRGLTDAERRLVDTYEQIGGGWSDAVPFDCEDACGPVTVEILVMDYWCNWSKAWTDVWVEDKTPVTVAKDVVDGKIYCATYKTARYDYPGEQHPVSLEWIVEQAKTGEQDALDALDGVFGGYCKAWVDPYGNYVDENGDIIEEQIIYNDSTCECTSYYKQIRVYDEHLGYLWVDSLITECYYDEKEREFWKGIVAVNCAENVQCEQTVWCDFDHCGQGYIYRKWKIWQGCPPQDGYGSNHKPDTITRVQKIYVGNECYLRKEMFDLPYDTEVYSCGIEYAADGSGNVSGAADPSITGTPVYKFDDDCRLVGIAYEDKVFKIVGGDAACYKIIRTWYFADWCTQGGYGPKNWYRNDGYIDAKYVQKIIVIDTIPPVCTISGPVEAGGIISAAGCEYDFSASVDVSDVCGVIEYYWELKDVTKEPHVVVDYGYGDLNSETEDNFGIHSDELLTAGYYKLIVRVTDDCQNESYCELPFHVETGKKPTPVCITFLTVELTPWDLDNDGEADTAAATIWAYEFDRSSQAPCGELDSDLEFYIEWVDDNPNPGDSLPEVLVDTLGVGCEDVGSSPKSARLWVVSPTGSFDYCEVFVVVQNNMGGCDGVAPGAVVRGSILTELEDEIEQVEVTATLSNGTVLNGVTSASGAYTFGTALGLDLTITPKKNIGYDNGVSTLDLVKIQKHILGKSLLESEMREVAADVNDDGKISALDLLEIRKLILGKTDQFDKVGSWKFFNELNKQENYAIENINGLMEIDWKGVKMGDVDYSNDPSRSAGRSGKSLVFNVDNVELIAGNQYRVDFKANNFNDITGYQFTLNFDKNTFRVLNVESGVLEVTADNFGLNRMDEGMLTTSWNAAEGMSIASGEVVFSLIVEATGAASLSDALTVNSRITDAEAYNSADQVHDVSLNFTNGLVETGFALYQNEPNPFREVTQVGFNLPEAMSATLTVYDVTGKVLKTVEGDYVKGYNQVSLKKADLQVTGVLYYQLDTEAFTATKKMIVIE